MDSETGCVILGKFWFSSISKLVFLCLCSLISKIKIIELLSCLKELIGAQCVQWCSVNVNYNFFFVSEPLSVSNYSKFPLISSLESIWGFWAVNQATCSGRRYASSTLFHIDALWRGHNLPRSLLWQSLWTKDYIALFSLHTKQVEKTSWPRST